jgi:hypothetical protein
MEMVGAVEFVGEFSWQPAAKAASAEAMRTQTRDDREGNNSQAMIETSIQDKEIDSLTAESLLYDSGIAGRGQ